VGAIIKKTRGRQSRATVPLKEGTQVSAYQDILHILICESWPELRIFGYN
jgi:hypothetical protein